jgi:arginase
MVGVTIVGAPTSAGAYAPGQEEAPAALRAHGLIEALEAASIEVTDSGDVDHFRWQPDPERPRAANAGPVAERARQVAERVQRVAKGERVLVLGGDCTVGVGTVAGLVRRGGEPGLVYLDRHADLNTPASTIDGALDWMGVAHMLDVEGAVDELAEAAGRRPMLTPPQLSFLGLQRQSPPEAKLIEERGLTAVSIQDAVADPANAARTALEALEANEIAVHFDVDVLDFLDAPLAENTDRGTGLPLQAAGEVLKTLLADPRVTAVTVTELNPHHGDPDGAELRRFVGVLAAAF